ncbi:MAG: S41 family peptidase [Lachnospiraceae bacterium]|nr:S41 family peptidase [Lachnospiraceae bacterium]
MEENNNNNLTNEFSQYTDNKEALSDEAIAELTSEELDEILSKEKSRGRLQGIIISLAIISAIAIIGILIVSFTGGFKSKKSQIVNDEVVEKTDYLWKMIDKYYLWDEDKDVKKAQDAVYKGIVSSLDDPYSVYYTKEEFEELSESYSGEYSGIGAYVSQDPDTMESYIARPMPNSPAEEAGLLPNDYICEIDGENVVGQDLNVVVAKIKGPEGTTVDIGIRHENKGEIETITVERRKIEVVRLESEMLEDNIGYIWIYEFEGKTMSQFEEAYNKLKEDGMQGLIVDLRDNPGGDLDVVINLCDKFLDDGLILYTKDKNGKNQEFIADADCEKIPMVIITNENSASASEIFTGCLKERGIAKVVGKNTFGKGIVQALFELQDGSGIKITESEYYLPNDICIHGEGIAPDYEVDLDYDAYFKDKTDAQKDKAIEVMKELLND